MWWLICAALLSPHLLPNFLAASSIWGLTFYLQAFLEQADVAGLAGDGVDGNDDDEVDDVQAQTDGGGVGVLRLADARVVDVHADEDRKSTRLNSSHRL